MRLLLLTLAAALLEASKLGGGVSRPSIRSDDDKEARIVEARVKGVLPRPGLKPAGENASDEENQTLSERLLVASQRALLLSADWLRRQNPGLWLLLATAMASNAHANSRSDKRNDLKTIRSQVLLDDDYHISIVTTASLPWMTGTAVNPLLRAAHLAKAGRRVTLMIPWVHPLEQQIIFPGKLTFETPAEQDAYIRNWLQERGKVPSDIKILFYPGRYDGERGSILPLGDITKFFGSDESDICVLEEPEHLTWYHNGPNWRHRFKLVVGVVHTNYLFYAQTWAKGGKMLATTMQHINVWVVRAYCDRVIKLSDTLQPLPRSVICNVHGVRGDFLDIGQRAGRPFHRFQKGAYFLGKVLWAKGHRLLLDYLTLQRELGQPMTHVDIFGKGEDLDDVVGEAERAQLDISFLPPTDHAGPDLRDYKVFVNPSQSEVLSTTTAEALAMGKFVVIQNHPSNDFFANFSNALMYDTPEEFLEQLRYALDSQPTPLTEVERRTLSWDGATERFLVSMSNATVADTLPSIADQTARLVHQGIQKGGYFGDAMRTVSGGGPISKQSWMHAQRFRDAEVSEIVEQSILRTPPVASSA